MTANCPYNPAHIMPIDSLLRHLSRCTATNKNEFTQCRYNQLHICLKGEIQNHEKKCPDNKSRNNNNGDSMWTDIREKQQWKEPQSRIEDWDHEEKPSPKVIQKASTRNTGRGNAKKQSKYEKDWSSESDEQQKQNFKETKKNVQREKEQKKGQKITQDSPFQADQSTILMPPKEQKPKKKADVSDWC